jgi:multidrug efflux pump subunit AcrB
VGGTLGNFIRAIPVTIIVSLITSLCVAIIFIPFFSRYLLLGKKQMGEQGVREVAADIEMKIARAIARPILWARGSMRRLLSVGIIAIMIGLGFIGGGLLLAQKVTFNIFPPTKDTNGLILNFTYPPNTTITDAEATAAQADRLASKVIGENFVQSSYFSSGTPQSAMLQVELTPYTERKDTSVTIASEVQQAFDRDFKKAKVTVAQMDVGPPSAAFSIQVPATDREAAYKLATDLAAFLEQAKLKRPDGSVATIKYVNVSSPNQYLRSDGKQIVTVSANFNGTDTTTLLNLAQKAVKDEFTAEKLRSYGLPADALQFDLGQESENQDSFKTLALAFPLLLCVIYLLLVVQFRSLLQPLLIFMAIPFSIFGVMLGLYVTHNAISFFTMLGFFALIGLSIKNTILLTDFANQARHSGLSVIDSIVAALSERFRPLIATSLTAVVSITPLAVTSPFWQGLAVVLIFGLLSSTFLVLTIFPYLYLGVELLRRKISPKAFFSWLLPTIILVALVTQLGGGSGVVLLLLAITTALAIFKPTRKLRRS